MKTTEKLGPAYEIELTRENGTLRQVTVSATGDGALGYEELRDATRQLLDHVRPERRSALPYSALGAARGLKAAHEAGLGPSSEEYLSRLAVTYAELAPASRDPAARIANVLGLSTQTVKQHLVKARKDGFLSPTAEGQKGGEATDKSRKKIAEFDHDAGDGTKISVVAHRKGSAKPNDRQSES